MRVASLLPSATEVLCAVGGREMLVGRSHECDFPPGLEALPVLTGQRIPAGTPSVEIDRQVREQLTSGQSLYTLDVERLAALRPDLILTQDLCEVCSIDLHAVRRAASAMRPAPAILSLNPHSLEDVFDDMLRVGEAVGRSREAEAAMVGLRERFFNAKDFVNAYAPGPEVAFLEWLDPIFVGGHWTPQMIESAGGRHSLNAAGAKSRAVSPAELIGSSPEFVVVCPCGLGLDAVRREMATLLCQPWWRELPAVQSGRVALVDGNRMFNRPGPRLVEAFEWLVGWLHGINRLIPAGFPWEEGSG